MTTKLREALADLCEALSHPENVLNTAARHAYRSAVAALDQSEAQPVAPDGWAVALGECLDGDSYASVSPDPSMCGEMVYKSRQPVLFAYLLALADAASPQEAQPTVVVRHVGKLPARTLPDDDAAQPVPEPLTDEQIDRLWLEVQRSGPRAYRQFARAIERLVRGEES